jgi:hypothetical protein
MFKYRGRAMASVFALAFAAALAACGGEGEDNTTGTTTVSGSGGVSGSNLSACNNVSYTGDKADTQSWTFDALAMLKQCQYRATNDTKYLTEGNQVCAQLNSFLQSTNSTFKPQYCSGANLRP